MILVLCPLTAELNSLVVALTKLLGEPRLHFADRLKLTSFGELSLGVGGHGKVQFGLTAGYLLERLKPTLLVCVGAAGALNADLSVGARIAATATVEHDFKLSFVQRPLPRFAGSARALDSLRQDASMHFGILASGDEDIVTRERALELRAQTQADAVAWEGAGAARAAKFYGVEFLELRVITDAADIHARESFAQSLEAGMSGLAPSLLKLLDNVRL